MLIVKLSATNKSMPMRPIFTAKLMRRHNTANTDQLRGSRASHKATGCRHRSRIPTVLPRTDGGVYAKKWQTSTTLVCRFACPVGVPVRNQAHRPTEGVQGYHGSHWLSPLGIYCGRYIESGQIYGTFLLARSTTLPLLKRRTFQYWTLMFDIWRQSLQVRCD